MELIAISLAVILAVVITLKVVGAYTKGKSSEIVTQSLGAVADRARGSRLEYDIELNEKLVNVDLEGLKANRKLIVELYDNEKPFKATNKG